MDTDKDDGSASNTPTHIHRQQMYCLSLANRTRKLKGQEKKQAQQP